MALISPISDVSAKSGWAIVKRFFCLNWLDLEAWGNSKVLRSSYYWLFLVPIAAKGLSSLPSHISVPFWGRELALPTELPFSWQLLYFASVCFAGASFVFASHCPTLIKNFPSWNDFSKSGRTGSTLQTFVEAEIKRRPKQLMTPLLHAINRSKAEDGDRFYEIREGLADDHTKARCLSTILFRIGFGLLFWILAQNFISVIRATSIGDWRIWGD